MKGLEYMSNHISVQHVKHISTKLGLPLVFKVLKVTHNAKFNLGLKS